jgi:uncharacterized membrane protein HdeD (DUF308 family)
MESTFDRATKIAQTQFTKMRWALGLNGLFSVVVGVLILVWPGISLYALTILFGAYAFANGLVSLIAAARGEVGERGWLVVRSVLGMGVGAAVLVWPSISALALLFVIGAYAIALGIIAIMGAFNLPLGTSDSWFLGLSGVVGILFGIAMFAEPGAGALVVLSLIAAFALVTGVTEIVFAVGAKRMIKDDVKRVLTPTPQTSST